MVKGGWNIADCVERSYDLEGMTVGSVAAGRIGTAVLRRLAPFDVRLAYTDPHRLPEDVERELGLTFYETPAQMVPHCDVVTINAPLYPGTEGLFNDDLIATMKRGAYIVNTARGKIADRDAIVRALESGQLAGYAGRRLVPSARPSGPPVADHAAPRHDAAHLRHLPVGAGPVRGGHPGDPRVLARRPAHPRRVPHHLRRRPGRHRSALLQALTRHYPAYARRKTMLSKKEAAQAVLAAKVRLGLTWSQLAGAVGRPVAWTTSALLGQQPMTADQAKAAGSLLDLDEDVIVALQLQPTRGALESAVPVDPTIYRFYEVLQVYGPTIKELIHEEFGDGIMSAINFRLDVRREPDPAGDRVIVVLDGKFLPYQW